MTSPPSDVAEIIRRKKLQYGRFVDTQQWSKMSEVALPDAKLSFFDPDGSPLKVGQRVHIFDSLASYCAMIGKGIKNGRTHHLFGLGELEQKGPDEVQAIFSVQETFKLNGALGLIYSSGGGYYYETWRRKGDDWFLAELRLQRMNVNDSWGAVVGRFIAQVVEWFGFEFNA